MACKTAARGAVSHFMARSVHSRKARPFPRLGTSISVVFGPPIPASDYDDPSAGKARYEIAAQRIMDASPPCRNRSTR